MRRGATYGGAERSAGALLGLRTHPLRAWARSGMIDPERHEWAYLQPGKGTGPKSIAYFRCMRCHIKRLRTVNSVDRATDVCRVVPYADRNRAAARERQRRLREE